MDDTFDYIIVGGGTAGCVLANRLSSHPDRSVLLLEAGGMDDHGWIHIPGGRDRCLDDPRTDWCDRTEPEPGLADRVLPYPRGRVVGGSSSIGAMAYLRGQRRDFDGWAAAGNAGWGWDDVLPLFMRSESHWSLDRATAVDAATRDERARFHGARGEWRVERQRGRWPLRDAFRDAVVATGIPAIDDFNRGDASGCGDFEVNQRRGLRDSTAKAFLHPFLKGPRERPNLVLATEVDDVRLQFDGRRCSGVAFRQRGVAHRIGARLETVSCAGTVGSPALLQRAGIGAPERLRAAGVTPRHALPGVGENLQDHLRLPLVFRVEGVRALATSAWHGKARRALAYLLSRSGPLAMAASPFGAYARSSPDAPHADLLVEVRPHVVGRAGGTSRRHATFTVSVCNLAPASRGSVRIVSDDPADAPRIAPGFLSNDDDRRAALASIRLARRIVSQEALRPHRPIELAPGPAHQTPDELSRAAAAIGTTDGHAVGTCRMGPAHDEGAVVDATLRVHGIDGLRVVDASIMPTITSGDPCAPTVMIAEKAALMIAERWREP